MSNIIHYELTTIIDSNISDNEHPEIIEKIKKLITKNEGQISSENNLGRKKLSYPIKKQLKGVFICLEFDIEPKTLKVIEKELKLNKNIIRYLIIKKPENVKPIIHENTKTPSETSNKIEKREKEVKTEKKKKQVEVKEETIKEDVKEEKKTKDDDQKSSLNELDKKLDEILNDDIIN
jgi:small subunit ribosomal protein S6